MHMGIWFRSSLARAAAAAAAAGVETTVRADPATLQKASPALPQIRRPHHRRHHHQIINTIILVEGSVFWDRSSGDGGTRAPHIYMRSDM